MRESNDTVVIPRRAAPPRVCAGADDRRAFFDWLERCLREDLRKPVRRRGRLRKRFTIMRGIEIDLDRKLRIVDVRRRDGAMTDDWVDVRLRLDRPLSGPGWALAWWWCVRAQLPAAWRAVGDGMVLGDLPDWINHAARHSGLLPAARRRIMAVLSLDPYILGPARRLSCDGVVHSRHYQDVWQGRQAVRGHLDEAPLLWPLYDVTGVPLGRDLHAVKAALRRVGLTRGGWLALCRHGRALWWPLRRCHEFQRDPAREIVFLANLVAATGRHDLPPPALTLALGRVASVNRLTARQACVLVRPFRAAWRHLEALPGTARAACAIGPVPDVLTECLLQGTQLRGPRGATWPWFVRWAARARQQARERRVPVPTFGFRRCFFDVEIIPLRDLRALREAGLALRNCMGRAEADIVQWDIAYFLLRERDGRALAMFSADACGACDEPLQMRGRYNSEPHPALCGYARLYLKIERHAAGTLAAARVPVPVALA